MDIKLKVTDILDKSGSIIQDIVVNKYTNVEIERRANILFTAINKLDDLKKTFLTKTDKPDIEEYDSLKTKITKYSKARIDLINKEKDLISNVEKLIEECLLNNKEQDYTKLDGIIKSLKGGDKQES